MKVIIRESHLPRGHGEIEEAPHCCRRSATMNEME